MEDTPNVAETPSVRTIKFNPLNYDASTPNLLKRANTFAQAFCNANTTIKECPAFMRFFEHQLGIFPEAVGAGADIVHRAMQTSRVLRLPLKDGTHLETQAYELFVDEAKDEDPCLICLWVIASELARKYITQSDTYVWGTRVDWLTRPILKAIGMHAMIDQTAAELYLMRLVEWRVFTESPVL